MIKEYLNYIKQVRGLSPNTCESYKTDLREWVKYASALGLRWSTISERDIDGWLMSMEVAGLSGKTRNRRLSALRGLLTWAQHKGLLQHNAARYCQTSKTTDYLPQTVSIASIDAYLSKRSASTQGAIVALAVSIMLESGLRISEVVNLRADDINKTERSIKILGKGRKERIVYYGDRTAKELRTWEPTMNGAIFAAKSPRTYRRMIADELRPFAGKVYPHALRHTFATAMLNAGMPITTLSMLMGHKKAETTQIYAKVATATATREYKQYQL